MSQTSLSEEFAPSGLTASSSIKHLQLNLGNIGRICDFPLIRSLRSSQYSPSSKRPGLPTLMRRRRGGMLGCIFIPGRTYCPSRLNLTSESRTKALGSAAQAAAT